MVACLSAAVANVAKTGTWEPSLVIADRAEIPVERLQRPAVAAEARRFRASLYADSFGGVRLCDTHAGPRELNKAIHRIGLLGIRLIFIALAGALRNVLPSERRRLRPA